MQILHRVPDAIHGSAELFEGVWIGGELDDVARFVAEEPERARVDLRLYIGYSGWSGGQLDGELAHGSWLPAPGSTIEIFAPDPSGVWREVMRSLGADWQGLDAQPPDPRWN
jgi:putative transcriptional regulator